MVVVEHRLTEIVDIAVVAAVCANAMIREVCYMLDGKFTLDDKMTDCFPTLGCFTDNVEILILIRDAQSDVVLRHRVAQELSDLLARFEAVAQSKDLRPRIQRSVRSSKKAMNETLEDSVSRLRRQWRSVVDLKLAEQKKQDIKNEIKTLLGIAGDAPAGGKSINVRAGNNWMHALAYVHSSHNSKLFEKKCVCSTRFVELDELGFNLSTPPEDFKVSRPVRRYDNALDLADARETFVAREKVQIDLKEMIRKDRVQFSLLDVDEEEDGEEGTAEREEDTGKEKEWIRKTAIVPFHLYRLFFQHSLTVD